MKTFIYLICSLWLSFAVHAAELKFEPATPIVEINKTVTLSVANTEGTVKWIAGEGKIQGEGNKVTYLAPDQAGLDAVTVLDSKGNTGLVKVVVTPPNKLSLENIQWETFMDRSWVKTLALSEDGKTLWVGTSVGLERRDAKSGELQQVFTNSDGLSNSWITALLDDGEGGVWVGTYLGGLAHRDLSGKWSVLTTDNSNIPHNFVTVLLKDTQGGLFIGTANGLIYIDKYGKWSTFSEMNSKFISDILSDGNGGLWVGIGELAIPEPGSFIGKGLAHLDAWGVWTIFTKENSELPDNWIGSLLNDGQNGVWIGTGGGLAHRNIQGKWTVLDINNSSLPHNLINFLLDDNQGGLWIGTWGGGLAHYDNYNKWTIFSVNNSILLNDKIEYLLSDGQGGVWVGMFWGGFAHCNVQGIWRVFRDNPFGLSPNLITSLLGDSQGGLWVGTSWNLTYRNAQGKWIESGDKLGVSLNSVTSLLTDSQGSLWIGMNGNGLARHNIQNQLTVFNTTNSSLPSNNVKFLLEDNQDGIWIGTDNGITRYSNSGEWTIFNTANSDLPSNHINALSKDNQGLWIGTDNGLVYYDDIQNKWTAFKIDNSNLPDNGILSLLSDDRGGLWVGTGNFSGAYPQGGGLAYRDIHGNWSIFQDNNSGLPNNYVTYLVSDGLGGLWIGTAWGLAHYDIQGKWTVFREDNSSLPSSWILSLLSDGQGGLWIGTWGGGLAHLTFGHKTGLCTQSQIDSAACQAIQQGKNAAIIVAAGGAQETDSLWENTEAITSRIYRTFYRRGFDKSNIYYLSSKTWADFDGDGFNDRINRISEDRYLTLDDLKKAIEWAKGLGKLDQPFYFFFMDHGGEGKLQLAPNLQLSAEEIKPLLDDYQNTTGNQLIVVIEACHSGSLIPALTAPNRAIITSAKTDEKAYFFEKKGFSRFFADYLLKGTSFSEAFTLATRDQDKLRGKNLQFQTAGGAGITTQTPQLDDNNDGKYDPAQDSNWLKTVYINGKFTTADDTLAIENLTPAATLSVGQTIQLQAKATVAQGTVKRVWAVIRPPRMAQVIDTNGTPILAFPRVNLVQSTESTDTWQTTWNDAIYNGNYTITFYAEDNEKNIASSEQDTILTVSGGIDPPMQAQVQIHLEKTSYQRGESFKATLTEDLGWGYDLYAAVMMPDGNYFTLKNTNELRAVKEAKLWYAQRKQSQSVTLLDLTLPADLPTGQYCLYGILSPEQNDVFEAMNKNLWVYGQQCFELF